VIEALQRFWAERAPRERAALAAAGAIVALALVFLVLIEPAWSGIAKLARGLPQQRAQTAELDALLAEAAALKKRAPAGTLSATETRTALEASMKSAGLKAARIVALTDGDLQVSFADVEFGPWTAWLAKAERELGARALAVTVSAKTPPGNVDIELSLRLARK
jgi:general secretion pathway protein M